MAAKKIVDTPNIPDASGVADVADVVVGAATEIQKDSAEPEPALVIASIGPRFCRCGRFFTREPMGIPLSELTENEIGILENDPDLIVRRKPE